MTRSAALLIRQILHPGPMRPHVVSAAFPAPEPAEVQINRILHPGPAPVARTERRAAA